MAKRVDSVKVRLEGCGFVVHRAIRPGRWYEAVSPTGTRGFVAKQSDACWHWFDADGCGTGSSADPARCESGGLGDAIGSDSQMATYRRIMADPPRELIGFDSIYRASCAAMEG